MSLNFCLESVLLHFWWLTEVMSSCKRAAPSSLRSFLMWLCVWHQSVGYFFSVHSANGSKNPDFYKLHSHFVNFPDILCFTADFVQIIKFHSCVHVFCIVEIMEPYWCENVSPVYKVIYKKLVAAVVVISSCLSVSARDTW